MNEINKRLVIKLGSEVFAANGSIDKSVFPMVASQAAVLRQEGVAITIVSSFAIKLGRIWLHENHLDVALAPPALAGIGQPRLMSLWQDAFLEQKMAAGQVLVSDANLMHRVEWVNVKSVIDIYHDHNAVPIMNANDPLSWAEAERFVAQTSDNDFLTAQLVPHIDATDVLFLTKVGGVFNGHPSQSGVKQYAQISYTDPPKVNKFGEGDSNRGMGPKIEYAINCYERGTRRVAITGLTADAILRFGRGEEAPTMIGTDNILC